MYFFTSVSLFCGSDWSFFYIFYFFFEFLADFVHSSTEFGEHLYDFFFELFIKQISYHTVISLFHINCFLDMDFLDIGLFR